MQDGRRRLVGIVDDDTAVRDSLQFLLEAAGFSVVTFQSAAQFLAAPAQDRIACLLLDHHMPEMTGLDLLRRLRRGRPDLPVALMTGSPSAEITRQALQLGATTVLEKPLTDHALFQFLGRAIT
jgi:FixJ family two-component response regulator